MTHFRTLAILMPHDDLEDIMKPYNEQDSKYYSAHNKTEWFNEFYNTNKDEYIERFKKEPTHIDFGKWLNPCINICTNEEELKKAQESHSDYLYVDENGECKEYCEYYNSNAKYDYYGRYSEFDYKYIPLKPNTNVDYAEGVNIADIDINKFIADTKKERAERYDKVHEYMGAEIPKFAHWNDIVKVAREHMKEDEANADEIWNTAVRTYSDQESIIKFKKKFKNDELEEYDVPRETYINDFTLPFGTMVDKNGWYEPCNYGWWGITYNQTMTNCEFRKKQIELLKKSSQGKAILLDCHI